MADKKKTGLEHLRDEIEKEILHASDEELREEAADTGDDLQGFAAEMRVWFESAKEEAGRQQLQKARTALERDRQKSAGNVVSFDRGERSARPDGVLPDTMAARHGKELSERDKAAIEDDLDELFDDNAWEKDGGDEDR